MSNAGTYEYCRRDLAQRVSDGIEVALPPGYYTVRSVEKIGFSQTPWPAKVHVRTGHWDKLNFAFDTGIR